MGPRGLRHVPYEEKIHAFIHGAAPMDGRTVVYIYIYIYKYPALVARLGGLAPARPIMRLQSIYKTGVHGNNIIYIPTHQSRSLDTVALTSKLLHVDASRDALVSKES